MLRDPQKCDEYRCRFFYSISSTLQCWYTDRLEKFILIRRTNDLFPICGPKLVLARHGAEYTTIIKTLAKSRQNPIRWLGKQENFVHLFLDELRLSLNISSQPQVAVVDVVDAKHGSLLRTLDVPSTMCDIQLLGSFPHDVTRLCEIHVQSLLKACCKDRKSMWTRMLGTGA